MNSVLVNALDYRALGLCPIPLRNGTKFPVVPWKHYQHELPDEPTIRGWFARGDRGLAIVCGAVSGGLVVRDFDQADAYERWANDHPELSSQLPTAGTSRGRHVYGRERSSKTGVVKLDDGEVRSNGAIVVAPPSRHPDGALYRWLVPLYGEIPIIDIEESGFLKCDRVDREDRGLQKPCSLSSQCSPSTPSSLSTLCSLSHTDPQKKRQIEFAIAKTLPLENRQRERQIFEFARELKAIEGLAEAPRSVLREIVEEWHKAALPKIRTKAFEETWIDFNRAMERAKYPAGLEPIETVFAQAVQAAPAAALAISEDPQIHLLAALCAELQRIAGEHPFYLDCRTAGRLLEVDHSTAARWLYLLCIEEILREESKGSRETRRASRYRFIAGQT